MPWFVPLGIAAASAVSAYLKSRKSARTSTSDNSYDRTSETTGGTRRYFAPGQEELLSPLLQRANSLITNPSDGLEPIRQQRRSQVNSTYAALPGNLAEQMLSHGGRSGKYDAAVRQGEYARLGALGGVDSEMSQLALQRQDQGLSLAERILGINFGSDTYGSTNESGTSSGQYVGAGDTLGSAIGSASQALAAHYGNKAGNG